MRSSGVSRPLSLTIVGWLFILVGGLGLVDALMPLFDAGFQAGAMDAQAVRDFGYVVTLRALALAGGAFILRGAGWARWMLAVWMAAHVVLRLQHSLPDAGLHAALFAVVAFALFRPPSSAYFRAA